MPPRRLPSLNALLAFEAAGRLGRMTRAGEELGVTHGAVSRQVRHLEAALGVTLFEGPKNRLALTSAGRALLADLTAGFDRIEAGVRGMADERAGALDVSCLGTFTMRWLIPRLHRFRAAQPGVEIRLSAADSAVDFARDAHEVAIRVTDHPLPANAPLTRLFDELVGPVMAPALAAQLRPRAPEDLARAPLLHTRTRPGAWAAWAARGLARGRPPRRRDRLRAFLLPAGGGDGGPGCLRGALAPGHGRRRRRPPRGAVRLRPERPRLRRRAPTPAPPHGAGLLRVARRGGPCHGEP
jgi:DNA-binding transcriptional LysR family regulator